MSTVRQASDRLTVEGALTAGTCPGNAGVGSIGHAACFVILFSGRARAQGFLRPSDRLGSGHRAARPPGRGAAGAGHRAAAHAAFPGPLRTLDEPRRQPDRLLDRGDRARREGQRAVAGRRGDRDRGRYGRRHRDARRGRADRRPDRRPGDGQPARTVRHPAVLPADRAEHRPVHRLGRLRAADHRGRSADRRPHHRLPLAVRAARGRADHRADDLAAGLDRGAAPLRGRGGGRRDGVLHRPAGPAGRAGPGRGQLARLPGRHRRDDRGLDLLRPDGTRAPRAPPSGAASPATPSPRSGATCSA